MSLLHTLFRATEKIKPVARVEAHCDVPCGIYDPHLAQMAAHTVIRMTQLIEEAGVDQHKISRCIAVKEEHAELCKHEIRILWGDYFKPDHAKKHKNLHDLVWKVMKLGSQVRQEVNLKASVDLLETVNKIAEIFWETKGIKTVKVKAPYPTERETVYPAF